jgi:hypothetical protein
MAQRTIVSDFSPMRRTMNASWQTPFLDLKAELRSLHDAGLSIRHGLILSASRSEEELQFATEWLEPACQIKKLAKSIAVATDGCSFHSHLFFADDRRGLNQLDWLLDGIDAWVDDVPDRLLPKFEFPATESQTDRNLLRWTSLVYYLAWEFDEVYLQAELEHLPSNNMLPFLPWIECPQPKLCDPRPWMIHQGESKDRIRKWLDIFRNESINFPDVLSAYLVEDFVRSSLAALDLLVYRLPVEASYDSREAVKLSKQRRRPAKVSKNSDQDLLLLDATLRYLHLNEGAPSPREPLTQEYIAEFIGWSQPRLSRRMKLMFPRGMKGYKDLFKGDVRRGLLRILQDKSREVDAAVWDDSLKDGSDNEDEDLS